MLTKITAIFFYIRSHGNQVPNVEGMMWELSDDLFGNIRAMLLDEGFTLRICSDLVEVEETLNFPPIIRRGSSNTVDMLSRHFEHT